MSFRLVPKSATLNDLDRRKGRYFALFHLIRYTFGSITSNRLQIYRPKSMRNARGFLFQKI